MEANKYKFRAKTGSGYIFKILIELVQKYIKDGCFVLTKNGISLTGVDSKTATGTKMISVDLPAERFDKYQYRATDPSMNMGINTTHLFKILKTIKKKDSLVFYILEESPLKLYIQKIQQGESENSAVLHDINITTSSPVTSGNDIDYSTCIVTNSKEFQKIKGLNKISKTIRAVCNGKVITFSCDKEAVYSGSASFGQDDDDVDNKLYENGQEFSGEFDTENIIDLVKLASTSNYIKIFVDPENYPLGFSMCAGNLGDVKVYIKSYELRERDERENDD
jgi:DNA polymerase III sliding clamp (beta) subunit (PCNA family)